MAKVKRKATKRHGVLEPVGRTTTRTERHCWQRMDDTEFMDHNSDCFICMTQVSDSFLIIILSFRNWSRISWEKKWKRRIPAIKGTTRFTLHLKTVWLFGSLLQIFDRKGKILYIYTCYSLKNTCKATSVTAKTIGTALRNNQRKRAYPTREKKRCQKTLASFLRWIFQQCP